MRFPASAVLVASALILASCPETVAKICEPGETQACVCSDGSQGAQVCHGQGSAWLECECDAAALDAGGVDVVTADVALADAASSDLASQDAASSDAAARDVAAADVVRPDGSMCHAADGGVVPCDQLCGAGDCPVDILFIIDNSGSMSEEQQQLAYAASSGNDPNSPCDAAGVADLQTYVGDNPGLSVDQWDGARRTVFESCGFIERLLISGNKFHLGVISTDMSDCDSPYGSGAQRGSMPQRGCLQTSPATPHQTVLDWQTPDVAQRFSDIVTSVLVYGSAYEKGLEAARHFLTAGHDVPAPNACDLARNCGNDLGDFLRTTESGSSGGQVPTKLLLVFMTDEEDCSHGGAIDEAVAGNTDLCYTSPALLLDPLVLASEVSGVKLDPGLVSAGIIAGYNYGASGPYPSGCKPAGSSVTDQCNPAYGNSVATCTVCVDEEPVCPCHPAMTCPGGAQFPAANCCQADAADRYDQFARQLVAYSADSICSSSYKAALNEILAAALPSAPHAPTTP